MTDPTDHNISLTGRLFAVLHHRMEQFFAGEQGIDEGSTEHVHVDAEVVADAATMLIGAVMCGLPALKDDLTRKLYCVERAMELDSAIRAAQEGDFSGRNYEGVIVRDGKAPH